MIITEPIADCAQIRMARGVTNALATEVMQALAEALDDAERQARGVLLCGGEKFFSNGAHLEWALERSSAGMREMFLAIGACVLRMLESRLPIVGVIKGHAIGAGLALLTAYDYRYGARGRVLLGKPGTPMGVPNPHFTDQLLRFVAGDFFASDLIYSGRLITAEDALTMHIMHGVADKDEVEALAWQQLLFLRDVPVAAFAESKHLRCARLCAQLREQMSARVARQLEIWNSDEAQVRLREAAKRLAR